MKFAEACLGGHAFIHPALEQRHMVLRPRVVARHAAVFQGFVNVLGLLFDLFWEERSSPYRFMAMISGSSRKSGRMSAAKLRGIGFSEGRLGRLAATVGTVAIVCPTLGRSEEKWKSAKDCEVGTFLACVLSHPGKTGSTWFPWCRIITVSSPQAVHRRRLRVPVRVNGSMTAGLWRRLTPCWSFRFGTFGAKTRAFASKIWRSELDLVWPVLKALSAACLLPSNQISLESHWL